ncbi:MAG: SUMF1/EgtB/PvdO family nonheme iron enzyme [Treponema sp.]|jgi:formylglycine-generating enzyme required for sulfatase activity|nr:SUMF1/EgtB/PvdO family nonheme iron enzyme [Treponema sp.]
MKGGVIIEPRTTPRILFLVLAAFMLLLPAALDAQQKYALVIGNGAYTAVTRLNNPVNDANDMKAALEGLGFTVDAVLNGDRVQMEEAMERLKNRLSLSPKSYGFFFYAGHGVQSGGENYLIPVDADIRSESYLRDRAVSVQAMLDELNLARNELNIVVLDACRDNPFSWKRSGSRGLQVIGNQPADSIIVYATSAGSTAADGTGRNGLFTGQLLKNLKAPGLEVREIFRRTHADVRTASGDAQRPAVYDQFGGLAYLSGRPGGQTDQTVPESPPPRTEPPKPAVAAAETGTVRVSSDIAGVVYIDGASTGVQIKAGGSVAIQNVSTGTTEVSVRAEGGAVFRAPTVLVRQGQTAAAVVQRPVPDGFVRINGGTFTMGSPANEAGRFGDEGPQHQVTVSGFYMGKYEVSQKEYQDVMGTNPSAFKGANLPVEMVSWFDAVEYCNKRSIKEGLTPAYTISGSGDSRSVTWNRNTNGYRLPTEAEWEYACRAGTTTAYNSGAAAESLAGKANVMDLTAKEQYPDGAIVNIRDGYVNTAPVGSFAANVWGLYDMHGNVWEWCWDWYGNYGSGSQTDPMGASSGSGRVLRGGSWPNDGQYLRSACRGYNTASNRYHNLGFRLLRPSL